MKKIHFAALLLSCFSYFGFSGDAAFFVDNGFSADGSVYVFSQYGQTDKTYRGWAEIYTVDVKKNKFVPGEVYMTNPSKATASRSGKDIYKNVSDAASKTLGKYACEPSGPDQILFISGDDSKSGTDEIVFKDFGVSPIESQGQYNVQLVPTVRGSGANVSSSFFIMLEKRDSAGKVLGRQKIGTPDFVRKGVSDYKIQKIICDKSGKNIVFVVEKTVHDSTGVSIRYMVETAALESNLTVAVK